MTSKSRRPISTTTRIETVARLVVDILKIDTIKDVAGSVYRRMIKGTRGLLLMNREDIIDLKPRTRLETALSLNEPLARAYYLKEATCEIWKQPDESAGTSTSKGQLSTA